MSKRDSDKVVVLISESAVAALGLLGVDVRVIARLGDVISEQQPSRLIPAVSWDEAVEARKANASRVIYPRTCPVSLGEQPEEDTTIYTAWRAAKRVFDVKKVKFLRRDDLARSMTSYTGKPANACSYYVSKMLREGNILVADAGDVLGDPR